MVSRQTVHRRAEFLIHERQSGGMFIAASVGVSREESGTIKDKLRETRLDASRYLALDSTRIGYIP